MISEDTRNGNAEESLVAPPDWLVSSIHDRGDFPEPIRYLAGITRCPTLRPNGTVIQTPGYDATTGLVYDPDAEYPQVIDSPSRETAVDCSNKLRDLVIDFPFVNVNHRSAWLSMLLTMVARPAIAGCCPMFAFDATASAAGKTTLCDLGSLIAYGTVALKHSLPSSDSEVRKVITAVALEAVPCCLFDNVTTTLGCASLDLALTTPIWSDRILGSSETTGALPMFTVWLATGNNLSIGEDSFRRMVYCRLESVLERPDERTDFKYADLLGHARSNRADLAVAAVTILRAYIAAGRPDMKLGRCSYPEWSSLVRSAIVWVGLPDPLTTRVELTEADRSSELLSMLHAGLSQVDPEGRGITTAEIEAKLDEPRRQDGSDCYPVLRAAVNELCGRTESVSRDLGVKLRSLSGRVQTGKKIASRSAAGGVKKWFLTSVEV